MHQSSPPVQSTSPIHQSSPPVQSTNPVHQSSPPVQSTSPVHQSSPLIQPTSPVHWSSPLIQSTVTKPSPAFVLQTNTIGGTHGTHGHIQHSLSDQCPKAFEHIPGTTNCILYSEVMNRTEYKSQRKLIQSLEPNNKKKIASVILPEKEFKEVVRRDMCKGTLS